MPSRATGVFEEPGEDYLCRQSHGVYTPGINRWPRVVPAGLSTQRNLAAAKPDLRDGGSLWLLFIVSWLGWKRGRERWSLWRGRCELPLSARFDLEVGIHPSFSYFIFFFPGGCNGEEQEQVLVGAGGTQRLVLGVLMGTQQPPVMTSVLRHQPLAMGDGVLGGWWGSRNVGSFAQALGTPWGCCWLVLVVSPAWQSQCCS